MEETNQPLRRFFEEYPLYRTFDSGTSSDPLDDNFEYPSAQFYCEQCKDERTFNGFDEFQSHRKMIWEVRSTEKTHCKRRESMSNGWLAHYLCAACKEFIYSFFIKADQEEDGNNPNTIRLRKAGQFPRFQDRIEKGLRKALGKNVELFEKGMASESFGFGIGAYSYYRRVVEDIISGLLEQISQFINEKEKPDYDEALKKVRATKDTTSKIDCVKHLLPDSLQPSGQNPLKIIHSALSEGLHGQSEDVCLSTAAKLRAALSYLVQEIPKRKNEAAEFEKSLKVITKHAPSRT